MDTDSNIDSDFLSDRDFDSDAEGGLATKHNNNNVLDAISEGETPAPPGTPPPQQQQQEGQQPQTSPVRSEDAWSMVDEADVESSNEMDIERGVQGLAISSPTPIVEEGAEEDDPDRTLTGPIRPLHRPYPLSDSRRRVLRSASSPSRSPIRVRVAERRRAFGAAAVPGKRTFYEFIFR